VRAGDNLHLIAGYYYRDPRQWTKIYQGNKKLLRNENLLIPGMVLQVETEPGQPWDVPYEEFVARVRRKK
jgi:nucleoid-associated protein YgaU